MTTRTARLNLLRGLLREFGHIIPVGRRHVLPSIALLLGDPEATLPGPLRTVLANVAEELRDLETRLQQIETSLEGLAVQIPAVAHLRTIPGIGLLTSTALVALVGDVRRFPSGRHFASYLGITPREHSSGTARRLGRISKRGDTYLRMLLTHGARSVLRAAKVKKDPDPFRQWALQLERRRGHNVATIAVANKLARFAWATWNEDRPFREAALDVPSRRSARQRQRWRTGRTGAGQSR